MASDSAKQNTVSCHGEILYAYLLLVISEIFR